MFSKWGGGGAGGLFNKWGREGQGGLRKWRRRGRGALASPPLSEQGGHSLGAGGIVPLFRTSVTAHNTSIM